MVMRWPAKLIYVSSILTYLSILLTTAACSEPIKVVDGDTIRISGEYIRIIGVDTPERYGCAKSAGRAAKRRLQELIDEGRTNGSLTIHRERRLHDKYRRTLGRIYVNKQSVADILIQEGHGKPYDGGKRPDWCPRGDFDGGSQHEDSLPRYRPRPQSG